MCGACDFLMDLTQGATWQGAEPRGPVGAELVMLSGLVFAKEATGSCRRREFVWEKWKVEVMFMGRKKNRVLHR